MILMTNYHGGNMEVINMKCKKCDGVHLTIKQNGDIICKDCDNQWQDEPIKEVENIMIVKEIFGKIEKYLVDLTNQWLNMPKYRKYEPANIQVYNHIRKEIDDLEKLKAEYIKEN